MKKLLIIISVTFLFVACKTSTTTNNANGESSTSEKTNENSTSNVIDGNGRFDDKSGILITETDMMGMGKMKMKMTFDDYGKKVLTEMNMNMMGKEVTNLSMSRDGYAYSWTNPASMSVKIKIDDKQVDEKNINYKDLSEELRKKMNMKEEGNETIDGKDCKVFSFSMKEGMAGKSWVWKGLPIQTEMNMAGKKIVTKFLSYDTNVSIPSSTFDLPAGVEFKEMINNAPATATK